MQAAVGDGDLTGSIVTTGLPVDTSTAGNVTVGYSVFDGTGNEGTAISLVSPDEQALLRGIERLLKRLHEDLRDG